MRQFLRDGGEHTLVVMHAKVAQKSYGTEKRSAAHIINYLRRGGYVFSGVSYVGLFVRRITQKLLNRFSQNPVKRCHMGYGRYG